MARNMARQHYPYFVIDLPARDRDRFESTVRLLQDAKVVEMANEIKVHPHGVRVTIAPIATDAGTLEDLKRAEAYVIAVYEGRKHEVV